MRTRRSYTSLLAIFFILLSCTTPCAFSMLAQVNEARLSAKEWNKVTANVFSRHENIKIRKKTAYHDYRSRKANIVEIEAEYIESLAQYKRYISATCYRDDKWKCEPPRDQLIISDSNHPATLGVDVASDEALAAFNFVKSLNLKNGKWVVSSESSGLKSVFKSGLIYEVSVYEGDPTCFYSVFVGKKEGGDELFFMEIRSRTCY